MRKRKSAHLLRCGIEQFGELCAHRAFFAEGFDEIVIPHALTGVGDVLQTDGPHGAKERVVCVQPVGRVHPVCVRHFFGEGVDLTREGGVARGFFEGALRHLADEADEVRGEELDAFEFVSIPLKSGPVHGLPCFHAVEAVAEAPDSRGVGIAGKEFSVTGCEVGGDGDDLSGSGVDDGASAVAGDEFCGDFDEFWADADDLAGEGGDDSGTFAVSEDEDLVTDSGDLFDIFCGVEFWGCGGIGKGEVEDVVSDGACADSAGFDQGLVQEGEPRCFHVCDDMDVGEERGFPFVVADEAASGPPCGWVGNEHEVCGEGGDGLGDGGRRGRGLGGEEGCGCPNGGKDDRGDVGDLGEKAEQALLGSG